MSFLLATLSLMFLGLTAEWWVVVVGGLTLLVTVALPLIKWRFTKRDGERQLAALESLADNSSVPRRVAWRRTPTSKTGWQLENVGDGEAWEVNLSFEGGLRVQLPEPPNPWPPRRAEEGMSFATMQSGGWYSPCLGQMSLMANATRKS